MARPEAMIAKVIGKAAAKLGITLAAVIINSIVKDIVGKIKTAAPEAPKKIAVKKVAKKKVAKKK